MPDNGALTVENKAAHTTTQHPPISRLRKVACVGTIAATLPYLALKIAWAVGSHVGVRGDAMENSTMIGANIVTVGMDAAAAGLALALVRPRGLRIPAWLLLFPLWVATGFIAPILVGAPLSGVVAALTGGGAANHKHEHDAAEDIAGWVFGVVYGGFILQGIGLGIGFFLYARSRWSAVFRLRLRDLPAGAGFAAQRITIAGVAAFSLVPSGIHLYWAAGGTGLRPDLDQTWQERLVLECVFALLPLVGSVAMLILAGRRDTRPARATLAAAWLGTGAMFAWGFWWMVCASLKVPLSEGKDMRGMGLVGSLGMLAGAVLATVLAQTVCSTLAALTETAQTPAPRTGATPARDRSEARTAASDKGSRGLAVGWTNS
ncbi:hypothetical protein [Streptomyces sp. NPDC037389]|uniref:hypothetical protein n=1 Tax=Streptomyces sp. NPDC037389 TaxID=3155369 RepID=UPI0033D66046